MQCPNGAAVKIIERRCLIMPAGDRTGPMGMGAMTGRGAGFCSGSVAPGYAAGRGWIPGFRGGFGPGRGFGRRFFGGGGFGWRNQFYATGLPAWARGGFQAKPDPEAEKYGLQQQASALESQLEMIRKRLDEMEKAS
jgi:hypothetical protein